MASRRAWNAGLVWVNLSVLAQAAANVFAKQAALESLDRGFMALLWNKWNILQLVALFCQACCWIMCLRKFSLSAAYPITSTVIGLNLLCAWLIFNEPVATHHVVAVATIMTGVALIGSRAKA